MDLVIKKEDASKGWTGKKENSISKKEKYKKVQKKKLEGKSEETCRLVLYTRNGDSRLKVGNEGKPLILKLGSMLNVN